MKKYLLISLVAAIAVVAVLGFNHEALSKKCSTYEVIVRDSNGGAVDSATVHWTSPGGLDVTRLTDINGKVTMEWTPGAGETYYKVEVSKAGYHPTNPASGYQTLLVSTLQAGFIIDPN